VENASCCIAFDGRKTVRQFDVVVMGAEVAEASSGATIAVVTEVTIDDLRHAVPSFPTRSELWPKLLEAYGL
jgi:pyruvate/2-oxoglutarate dehydrogenase complex dihydrolipoamide dehydrogenase (E3) component